ncbi:MAG TPA: alpha/beta hydrolase [Candidatus Saccharimonadales bacterium]|nr:alpha/beta hydrolase [Candidatus Saccharimonadales bacterium]
MKNAIILHGRPDDWEYYGLKYPAQSNSHWIPWLQKRLHAKDIFTQTPEIPMSFRPDYNTWKKEFERFDVGVQTILVGHSCGGGFLVRWLTENKTTKVGKVVLVAPWLNPEDSPKSETGNFFHFEIDENIAGRTSGLTIFVSDNDEETIHKSVDIIKATVKNLKVREFRGKGHFTHEYMPDDTFPELLEECLAGNT